MTIKRYDAKDLALKVRLSACLARLFSRLIG